MGFLGLALCALVAVVCSLLRFLFHGPPRPAWDMQFAITMSLLRAILKSLDTDDLPALKSTRESIALHAASKRATMAGMATKSMADLSKDANNYVANRKKLLPKGLASKQRDSRDSAPLSFYADQEIIIQRLDAEIVAATGNALAPFHAELEAFTSTQQVPPLTGEWVHTSNCAEKNSANGKVVLYLHGGAFVAMSAEASRGIVVNICVELAAPVFGVNYRLAPEFPFPGPLLDAVSAYIHLLRSGIDSSRIVLMGDSAGAGLALCVLVFLRDHADNFAAALGHAVPLPRAAVLFSPWADLSLSLQSVKINSDLDYLSLSNDGEQIGSGFLYAAGLRSAECYANPAELQRLRDFITKNPYISPARAADLSCGLPPILIQCGGCEMLLSEQLAIFYVAQRDKLKYPHANLVPWVTRMTEMLTPVDPLLKAASFQLASKREWQLNEPQMSNGAITVEIYRDMVHALPAFPFCREFFYSMNRVSGWLEKRINDNGNKVEGDLLFVDVNCNGEL